MLEKLKKINKFKLLNLLSNISILSAIVINFIITLILYYNTTYKDFMLLYFSIPFSIIFFLLVVFNIILDYINFFKNSKKSKKKVITLLVIVFILIGASIYCLYKFYTLFMASDTEGSDQFGQICAGLIFVSLIVLWINSKIIKRNTEKNNVKVRHITYILFFILTIIYAVIGEFGGNVKEIILYFASFLIFMPIFIFMGIDEIETAIVEFEKESMKKAAIKSLINKYK